MKQWKTQHQMSNSQYDQYCGADSIFWELKNETLLQTGSSVFIIISQLSIWLMNATKYVLVSLSSLPLGVHLFTIWWPNGDPFEITLESPNVTVWNTCNICKKTLKVVLLSCYSGFSSTGPQLWEYVLFNSSHPLVNFPTRQSLSLFIVHLH